VGVSDLAPTLRTGEAFNNVFSYEAQWSPGRKLGLFFWGFAFSNPIAFLAFFFIIPVAIPPKIGTAAIDTYAHQPAIANPIAAPIKTPLPKNNQHLILFSYRLVGG
jgi:hypothetical protein